MMRHDCEATEKVRFHRLKVVNINTYKGWNDEVR